MKTKVCIMARVSNGRHQNPEHQITALQAFCEQRGYTIVHEISTIVTGNTTNKKREDITELLALAKEGRIEKVVVSEVSRLGRRANEIRKVLDELHSLKISVVFRQLGVESLSDDKKPTLIGSLVIAIYSELATHEGELMSERIRSGLTHAKEQGKQIGRQKGSGESSEELLAKYKPLVKSLKKGFIASPLRKNTWNEPNYCCEGETHFKRSLIRFLAYP